MKLRLLPLIFVASLSLVACGADEPATPAQKPVSLTVDAPKVTLLAAGEGNMEVVAFADAGSSQQATLQLSDGFDQGTGEAGQLTEQAPANPHAETLTAGVSATVTDTGTRSVSLKINDPKHSNIAYASDVLSTDGFELGWQGKTSGLSETVQLTAPTNSTDQGRAIAELYLMKLLAQPIIFPTEAIAPGASWTVENRVAGDSTMLRSTTYTLESKNGTRVELAARISERPAVSALNLEGQGGQGELKVLNTDSAGTGHVSLDLGKPLPDSGEFTLTTRVTYGQDDSPKRVFQDFHSGIKFI